MRLLLRLYSWPDSSLNARRVWKCRFYNANCHFPLNTILSICPSITELSILGDLENTLAPWKNLCSDDSSSPRPQYNVLVVDIHGIRSVEQLGLL